MTTIAKNIVAEELLKLPIHSKIWQFAYDAICYKVEVL